MHPKTEGNRWWSAGFSFHFCKFLLQARCLHPALTRPTRQPHEDLHVTLARAARRRHAAAAPEVPDPFYYQNASLVTIPRQLLENLLAHVPWFCWVVGAAGGAVSWSLVGWRDWWCLSGVVVGEGDWRCRV